MSTHQIHTSDSWIAKQVVSNGGSRDHAYQALSAKPNVNIIVQYCGDWGYAPRFEDLAGKIKKKFIRNIKQLNIVGKKDEGATGNFEVFVNNVLVHSKTTQNEGFVDTNLKEEKLYNLIKKALNGDSLGDEEEDDATSYGTMLTLDTDDEANSKTENEAAERKSLIFSIATLVLSIPALIGAWCWPALVVSLVSGTVSGFARTLGHYISFGVTVTMMIVVNIFIANGIKYRFGTCCQKYGPFILTMIAAPLICADLTRHVLNDTNIWPWCGDPSAQYGLFPRVNVSWSADCLLSSTQFVCTIPCCVPGNNSAPADWQYQEKDGMLPPYWPEYPQLSNETLKYIVKETIEGGTPPDQVEPCNCDNCVPLADENMFNLSPIGILFTIIFTYTGFTLLAIGTMWNANIIKKCGELREKWNELRGTNNGRSKSSVNNYKTPLVGNNSV